MRGGVVSIIPQPDVSATKSRFLRRFGTYEGRGFGGRDEGRLGEEGRPSGRLGEEWKGTSFTPLLFTYLLTPLLLFESSLSNWLILFSSTGSTHMAETQRRKLSQERIAAERTTGRGHCCSEFKRSTCSGCTRPSNARPRHCNLRNSQQISFGLCWIRQVDVSWWR